jgi:hypothetical protein
MSSKGTNQAFEELKKEIAKHGKVCIIFTHYFYGGLRSLNFILENPDAKDLDDYLTGKNRWQDVGQKIWEKTMMAVVPQIIPMELIKEMETPPKSFKTIKEGEAHIKVLLEKNPKDPYYYRLGIL